MRNLIEIERALKTAHATMALKTRVKQLVTAGAMMAAMAVLQPAHAAIMNASGTGLFSGSAAGIDLGRGDVETNFIIRGYDEAQLVETVVFHEMDAVVGVNLTVGGTIPGADTPGPGFLLGPGRYHSHILHFDPIGSGGVVGAATFEFDSDVVALVFSNETADALAGRLDLTDSVFGNANEYEFRRGRGIELVEDITLTASNTITIQGLDALSLNMDQLRVVTSAAQGTVPEPGTMALLASCGAFVAWRRKRKAKGCSSF